MFKNLILLSYKNPDPADALMDHTRSFQARIEPATRSAQ